MAFAESLRNALRERYELGAELGRGAMSVVYRARDLRYERDVAIKVLRSEVSAAVGTARFLREIAIAARLQHPHILPLLDSGEAGGLLYYVMPCVDGQSLRNLLDVHAQLPIAEAIRIAREVGIALAYAHDRGVVHRDIKPANILLSSGVAIVSDFGIARALAEAGGDDITASGLVIGTIGYMSPEQAVGDARVDARSDVFSLGCVLYEMLAGEPPFTGPTMQAVTARVIRAPMPPLGLVRNSITPALERVVERALAKTPADRFQTAGEFVHALEGIHAHPLPQPARSRRRLMTIAGGSLAILALVALFVSGSFGDVFTSRDTLGASVDRDTTKLVLLPLEPDTRVVDPAVHHHLFHSALEAWRGLSVIDRMQVADALGRRPPLGPSADASDLANSLGAGRFIRGTLTTVGDSTDASAALFDVGNSIALASESERIPSDPAGASLGYARLARRLLLRGSDIDLVEDTVRIPRSLPAAQALGRAQLALDGWDLTAADSAFEKAVEFDPTDPRALLWLAQVRSWRDLPLSTWSVVAERAASGSAGLSERERMLSRALVLLARRQYPAACAAYQGLRTRNDRDFAAWFGLGECRRLDLAVIPDSTSPSKWRFRSSYHQAMEAYARAFEVLPSVHRGFERGAFERLRVLLLIANTYYPGVAVTGSDTAVFFSRPSWRGDTLSLIPYPWEAAIAGGSAGIPPGFLKALDRQRNRFRAIADGWSAAFPRSSGAKEAVAIALEMHGEPSAIDTLRLARRLATDSSRAARLLATEALLLVKFGTPDRVDYLRTARAIADSLLSSAHAPLQTDQQLLSAIAALAGRCNIAEAAARASPAPALLGIPPRLVAEANALLARTSLGCRPKPPTPSPTALLSAIAKHWPDGDAAERQRVTESIVFRTALLAPVLDSALLDQLGRSSAHSLLQAGRAHVRHDAATTRAVLEAFGAASTPGVPMTPDMALAGARLWTAIGDTAAAVEWLDRSLDDVTSYDPLTFSDGAVVASFVRATLLRADLAAARKDAAGAARWRIPASVLWERADADVRQALKPARAPGAP